MTAVSSPALLGALPDPWQQDLLPHIRALRADESLVVLDDDPTGTQTVADVPVLLDVDEPLLRDAVERSSVTFLSTNSRALSGEDASALAARIGAAIRSVEASSGRRIVALSRGDSTLRGHYPDEVHPLAMMMGSDLTLIVPALVEAGRMTVGGVHYVRDDDTWTPVGETEFARDVAFGFSSSTLRDWVAERDAEVNACDVLEIGLDLLRNGGPEAVSDALAGAPAGSVVVADGVVQRDLEVLAAGVLEAERRGRRVLARCAASYVRARAGMPVPAPVAPTAAEGPGLLVVGSHARRTTDQLEALVRAVPLAVVELDVELAAAGRVNVGRLGRELDAAIAGGRHVALVSSRSRLASAPGTRSLVGARAIAATQAAVVAAMVRRPAFIVAKGGITAYCTVRHGLGVKHGHVVGPVARGVAIWRVQPASCAPLEVAVFPGNVGGAAGLVEVWRAFAGTPTEA